MSEDWAQQHPGRLGYIAFPAGIDSDMTDIVDPPSHNEPGSGFQNTESNDAANTAFNDMLDNMDFDGFEPASFYKLSMDSAQGSNAALNMFSASDADALQNLDHSPTLDSSSLSQTTTGNNTPISISPMQVNFGQKQQQQKPQPQQQQQDHSIRQQPEPQARAHLYQHQIQSQSQSQPQPHHRRLPHGRSSPPPSCQCIPGLSSLLHDLKRATDDKIPPAGLDDVLSRVSEALAQWSALAACPRCQNHDSEDDEGETLLLAALSMRRVVAQLRAVGCRPGAKGFGEETATEEVDDDTGPQLHVGAYQVTGSDRTMLLGVLRTITVRKLDAAVTTLRSMLRTKQARHSGTDSVMLLHIEAMLDELARTIKRLQ